MPALVLWEVSRKQDYIFESNKLRENRGASIIIEYITEELPKSLNKGYEKNLIYNGGGNSLYKFDNADKAKEFIKDISEKVLEKYPGVQLFMTYEEYDDKKDRVIDIVDDIHHKLNVKKNRRENSGLQVSFGIESICESSGLPASFKDELDENGRLISEEVYVKIKNSYNDSCKFKKLIPEGYEPIREFRDLATEKEKNYLAIVHIDGNQMGKKLMKLRDYIEYEDGDCSKGNEEYLKALRKFSDNVKKAYEGAFKEMTRTVERNKEGLEECTRIKENRFPVIPIIVAGDDVTYATNGKIGIESARVFLEYLNNNPIEIYKGERIKLNACAGVAIARTSHPFYNTYKLAESLCRNAKMRLLKEYPNEDYSLIDWHIEQGDLLGSIPEIREKYYKSLDGLNLCIRPLYINNKDEGCWRNYDNFIKTFNDITDKRIYDNKIARNKIKALREIFRKGKKDTEIYLKTNKIENFFNGFWNMRTEYCFSGDTCLYYDAVEILDYFLKLE